MDSTAFGDQSNACGTNAPGLNGIDRDKFNNCLVGAIGISSACSECYAMIANYGFNICKVVCWLGWCKHGRPDCATLAQIDPARVPRHCRHDRCTEHHRHRVQGVEGHDPEWECSPCIFRDAPQKVKHDREIVLVAVNKDNTDGGRALQYAAAEANVDHEMVLATVKDYWRALDYVADEVKQDREMVLATVKEYGQALAYAVGEVKPDREIILATIQDNVHAFDFVLEGVRGDELLDLVIRNSFKMTDIIMNIFLLTMDINFDIYSLSDFARQMRNGFLDVIGANMLFNGLASTALMFVLGDYKFCWFEYFLGFADSRRLLHFARELRRCKKQRKDRPLPWHEVVRSHRVCNELCGQHLRVVDCKLFSQLQSIG